MQKLSFILWSFVSVSIALFLFLLGSVSGKSVLRAVEINPGGGFKHIAYELHKQGLIRSPYAFMIYGIFSGSAHQLKPGNYLLNAGSSTPEILQVIVSGPVIDTEVTVIEGATLKDIDFLLAKAGVLPEGAISSFLFKDISSKYKFMQGVESLEGFLFPDTYHFFLNSETTEVIKKFLDNFENKTKGLFKDQSSLRERIIVASLLEKEAPVFKDRQIISGIFYKRLSLGMPLQVDSTITYAKCSGAFLTCDDPKVYRRDLDFNSKYNTYLYKQLPPGPIGNPGLEAIKAALDPVKSNYLYYLSDPKTKKTIFSETLEEHNENRAKYLGS